MGTGTIVQGISAMLLIRKSPRRWKKAHLFITAFGGPIFLLGKMRITIDEPVIRQGSSTIVTKGIISCVVGFSNTEGMRL